MATRKHTRHTHTYVSSNAVTLVWGSLRLAPINPCKIFECVHLKFTVSGWSKQANQQGYIDTDTHAVMLVWG